MTTPGDTMERSGDTYKLMRVHLAWRCWDHAWQASRATLPQAGAAREDGWISVDDEMPRHDKKRDSFGVEVQIWPPHEDGSHTAFYGVRQTRTPAFYKYGAVLHHVRFWRYPAPPPASVGG